MKNKLLSSLLSSWTISQKMKKSGWRYCITQIEFDS